MSSQSPDREASARSYRPLISSAPTPLVFSAIDFASLLMIVLIWGSNFVVMKVGLRGVGPMMPRRLTIRGGFTAVTFFCTQT